MSKKHTKFVIIENPHPDGKRYTTACHHGEMCWRLCGAGLGRVD